MHISARACLNARIYRQNIVYMLEISKGICNFILIVSIEGKRGQLLISGKIVGSLAISSDYIGSPMIKTLVERVQEICHSILCVTF